MGQNDAIVHCYSTDYSDYISHTALLGLEAGFRGSSKLVSVSVLKHHRRFWWRLQHKLLSVSWQPYVTVSETPGHTTTRTQRFQIHAPTFKKASLPSVLKG